MMIIRLIIIQNDFFFLLDIHYFQNIGCLNGPEFVSWRTRWVRSKEEIDEQTGIVGVSVDGIRGSHGVGEQLGRQRVG
jgi:hypothetical protein